MTCRSSDIIIIIIFTHTHTHTHLPCTPGRRFRFPPLPPARIFRPDPVEQTQISDSTRMWMLLGVGCARCGAGGARLACRCGTKKGSAGPRAAPPRDVIACPRGVRGAHPEGRQVDLHQALGRRLVRHPWCEAREPGLRRGLGVLQADAARLMSAGGGFESRSRSTVVPQARLLLPPLLIPQTRCDRPTTGSGCSRLPPPSLPVSLNVSLSLQAPPLPSPTGPGPGFLGPEQFNVPPNNNNNCYYYYILLLIIIISTFDTEYVDQRATQLNKNIKSSFYRKR